MCLRPIVPLTILGINGSVQRMALIDSGADSVVLPTAVAPMMGIDLAKAYAGSVTTAGTTRVSVRYAKVLLELDDGNLQYRWKTHVGFAPVQISLLGTIGGLEFFKASIDYSAQELTLLAQSNLPTTVDSTP